MSTSKQSQALLVKYIAVTAIDISKNTLTLKIIWYTGRVIIRMCTNTFVSSFVMCVASSGHRKSNTHKIIIIISNAQYIAIIMVPTCISSNNSHRTVLWDWWRYGRWSFCRGNGLLRHRDNYTNVIKCIHHDLRKATRLICQAYKKTVGEGNSVN